MQRCDRSLRMLPAWLAGWVPAGLLSLCWHGSVGCRRAAHVSVLRKTCPPCVARPTDRPPLPAPPSPSALQAQQALSVALNKVGELHHLQGDLPAAAGLYAQALQLRRSLLAATQAQWPHAGQQHQQQQQSAAGPAAERTDLEAGGGGEAGEACCSAALDLAASCIKLAGARRELDALAPEAEVSSNAVRSFFCLQRQLVAACALPRSDCCCWPVAGERGCAVALPRR